MVKKENLSDRETIIARILRTLGKDPMTRAQAKQAARLLDVHWITITRDQRGISREFGLFRHDDAIELEFRGPFRSFDERCAPPGCNRLTLRHRRNGDMQLRTHADSWPYRLQAGSATPQSVDCLSPHNCRKPRFAMQSHCRTNPTEGNDELSP